MALRFYITKLAGDGQTEQTAFRSPLRDILPNSVKIHNLVEDQNGLFTISVADVTLAQHNALVASADIFNIRKTKLSQVISERPVAERQIVNQLMLDIGLGGIVQKLSATATYRDLITMIQGSTTWAAMREFINDLSAE